MSTSAEFRAALDSGDVRQLQRIWSSANPHLPRPANDAEAEIVMHRARTEAISVSFQRRAYSHRWLTERGLPSGLPNELKPKAERLYPVIVEAVGISVITTSKFMRTAALEIRQSMSDAVAEAYADGRTDADFVKTRMQEARAKSVAQLFGRGINSIPKG
jgi:hypothetical protein